MAFGLCGFESRPRHPKTRVQTCWGARTRAPRAGDDGHESGVDVTQGY